MRSAAWSLESPPRQAPGQQELRRRQRRHCARGGTVHSLARSSSRELLECPGLSSVLGRTVDAVPDGGPAAGAEAACRGEGCGVERALASGGLLATGVTRCCCDADCLGPFSFSFSLASLALDEEPPMQTKFQRPRITQQQLGENANTSLNLTRLCAGAIPNHWMKEGRNLKLCVKQLCFKPQPPRKLTSGSLVGGFRVGGL